jgi:death-on-curing protein
VKQPAWLTRTVVEAVHTDLIREHGGALGIRDEGLLESALARPQQKWSYDEAADLAELAAAYGYGLARNHGFIDGNKRVALMAMYIFLALNGRELSASEPETVSIVTAVAAGSVSEAELGAWVRAHLARYRQ